MGLAATIRSEFSSLNIALGFSLAGSSIAQHRSWEVLTCWVYCAHLDQHVCFEGPELGQCIHALVSPEIMLQDCMPQATMRFLWARFRWHTSQVLKIHKEDNLCDEIVCRPILPCLRKGHPNCVAHEPQGRPAQENVKWSARLPRTSSLGEFHAVSHNAQRLSPCPYTHCAPSRTGRSFKDG
jgi:hypothetical protein